MEVVCPNCRTRYHLDDATTPRRRLRLRCATCSAQFPIDLRLETRETVDPGPANAQQRWALRLARTLISDILIDHRARRDRALSEGRLLDEFSAELTAAWRAFRTEADAESEANLFRHAVNTLLGDGRPLL